MQSAYINQVIWLNVQPLQGYDRDITFYESIFQATAFRFHISYEPLKLEVNYVAVTFR